MKILRILSPCMLKVFFFPFFFFFFFFLNAIPVAIWIETPLSS